MSIEDGECRKYRFVFQNGRMHEYGAHLVYVDVESDHIDIEGLPDTLLYRIDEGNRALDALHSLTPGGSEFVGEVDACVAYIRYRRHRDRETIKRLRRKRDEAREKGGPMATEGTIPLQDRVLQVTVVTVGRSAISWKLRLDNGKLVGFDRQDPFSGGLPESTEEEMSETESFVICGGEFSIDGDGGMWRTLEDDFGYEPLCVGALLTDAYWPAPDDGDR